MEFDIVNTILTDTVGSLFREDNQFIGKDKNLFQFNQSQLIIKKLQQNDTDIEEKKSSISKTVKQQSNQQKQNPFSTQVDSKASAQSGQQFRNQQQNNLFANVNQELLSDNQQQQVVGQKKQQERVQKNSLQKQTLSIEQWLQKDGIQLYNESVSRLNINLQTIRKQDLEQMATENLILQKKKVKNELKQYDIKFSQIFGRYPIRQEKEPLRPLYIYYKKLKEYITKNSQRSDVTSQEQPSQPIIKINQVSNDYSLQSIGSINDKSNQSISIPNNTNSVNTSKDNLNQQQQQVNPPQQQQQQPGSQQQGSNSNPSQQKQQIALIQKQISDLKKQRSQIREKLYVYQNEFTKNNNRKILYHKDILPVEKEYKEYKDIKGQILQLEVKLKELENKLKESEGGAKN